MDFLLIYIMSIQRIMKRLKYIRYNMYTNSLTTVSGILKCLMDALGTTVLLEAEYYTFELIKLENKKRKKNYVILQSIAVLK